MDALSFMLGSMVASSSKHTPDYAAADKTRQLEEEVSRLRARVAELEAHEYPRPLPRVPFKKPPASVRARPKAFLEEPWEGRWLTTNDGQILMISLDAGLTEEQEWDLKLVMARARARLWEFK